MAYQPTFFDMVNVTVTGSPGTSDMTLGSALIGFQNATGIANNTWISYRATDGTNWETAHGKITISGGVATLASRGTDTLVSSNSNALVSFGAGVTVIICPTSQDLNAFVSGLSGSWTPTDASGAGLTFTGLDAEYNVVGNLVFAFGRLTYPGTADGSAATVEGLPFTIANRRAAQSPSVIGVAGLSQLIILDGNRGTTSFGIYKPSGFSTISNETLSVANIVFTYIYTLA